MNYEIMEHNERVDEIYLNNPDMMKPKLKQLRNVPPNYDKRIYDKNQMQQLPTIVEDDENLDESINDSLYKQYGNFGQVVELSRKQILEGFVRPEGLEKPKKKDEISIEDIPKPMPEFENTFD